MNKLIKAYRLNTLTPRELHALREEVNLLSDEELAVAIHEDWDSDDLRLPDVDGREIVRMKRSIDVRIEEMAPARNTHSLIVKSLQIAAAILLPVFIISTFYLYRENNRILSDEMVVMTGKGERASVVLPDGTKVALNHSSRITYLPKLYKNERKIQFDGEAYFQVIKDKERPFVINAKGLKVNVLGTTFNLFARNHGATAELALEEGVVQMVSLMSGQQVVLSPNQKAILDHRTQKITVIDGAEVGYSVAWKKGELIFRNEKLKTVLQSLEDNYNIRITVEDEKYQEDLFTGTLPSSDLNEVLEVLEKLYHFRATVKEREVTLHKE